MASNPDGKQFVDTITVGLTGASGAIYGLRLLKYLVATNYKLYLLISDAAKIVLDQEEDLELGDDPDAIGALLTEQLSAAEGQLTVFGNDDWFSPVASGGGSPDQMVVCPCTAGTLSAIAHGASDNLLERAADVVIKERKKLILVPRETPLSPIHLENMLKLSQMGVTILPASPSFYNRPKTVIGVVDSVVSRVLDHLGVPHQIAPKWGIDSDQD
jgi:4-hydroxy-3-polyprenylbenzoate decarboxylase